MITRWLVQNGSWKSLTANERCPWEESGGGRRAGSRRLGSDQACRWWHNELALTAAPCFRMRTGRHRRSKTFFTLFSIFDRMHRPQ